MLINLLYYFFICLIACFFNSAISAPFEIKVHDELIADFKGYAVEIETNLYQAPAAENLKTNVLQSRFEFAYGITKNSEISVNLYGSQYNGTTNFNGGKIAYMFVPTHDETGWFHYGIKTEMNFIQPIGTGSEQTFFEITPILAFQMGRVRVTLNPSVDILTNGSKKTVFAPAAKVAYGLDENTSVGVEYYSEMGSIKKLTPLTNTPDTAYLVLDTKYGHSNFNVGVGKGINSTSDNWVLKLIASIDIE